MFAVLLQHMNNVSCVWAALRITLNSTERCGWYEDNDTYFRSCMVGIHSFPLSIMPVNLIRELCASNLGRGSSQLHWVSVISFSVFRGIQA